MKSLLAVPVLTLVFTGGVYGVARLFEERRGMEIESEHVSERYFHQVSPGLSRTIVLEGGTYVIEEAAGEAQRRSLDQGDWRRIGSAFEGRSIHGGFVRGAFLVTPSGGKRSRSKARSTSSSCPSLATDQRAAVFFRARFAGFFPPPGGGASG